MNSDLVIKVNNISKEYEKSEYQSKVFKEWILLRIKQLITFKWNAKSTFKVLDNVSFNLYKGEVVGLIGKNGSGKSTLLKILSQISPPSNGNATIYGRTASIIEVGTGFQKELSARENIFINGAILGMKKKEIKQKLDAIVTYAEIDNIHLDLPIKKLSTGMRIRLAFSIAAHLSADVLFLDEVLAVSDHNFQEKSINTIKELANQGKTIIFVSHDLVAIKKLCSRLLIIDEGQLSYDGDVSKGIDTYLKLNAYNVPKQVAPSDYDLGFIKFYDVCVEINKMEVQQDRFRIMFDCNCIYYDRDDLLDHILYLSFVCFDPSHEIQLFQFSTELQITEESKEKDQTLSCVIEEVNLAPGTYPIDLKISSKQRNHGQSNFALLEIPKEDDVVAGLSSNIIKVNSKWKTLVY